MSPASIPTQPDALLAIGLKNLWFPICRSDQIADQPLSMRRLGHKLALWRDTQGARRGAGRPHRLPLPRRAGAPRRHRDDGARQPGLPNGGPELRAQPSCAGEVLAQDREMMEDMEADANQREMLYQHDMGLVRLRRHLRGLATRQIAELAAAPAPT